MSKTFLAVALVLVLLGSVIPETGAIDRQITSQRTLVRTPFVLVTSGTLRNTSLRSLTAVKGFLKPDTYTSPRMSFPAAPLPRLQCSSSSETKGRWRACCILTLHAWMCYEKPLLISSVGSEHPAWPGLYCRFRSAKHFASGARLQHALYLTCSWPAIKA